MTLRRPLWAQEDPSGLEAEIERQVFRLIEEYAEEPAPFVLWLSDRIASHEIVTRLRLVPARRLTGRADA
jgi:hypothetical protein